LITKHRKPVFGRPTGRNLTSFRENISVAAPRVWGAGADHMPLSRAILRDESNAVQVKYD